MKKLIAMLLALILVLGLAACGAKTEPAPEAAPTPEAAPAPEAAPEQEEAPVEEAAPALVVDTRILKEADDQMLNTYSAIAVNPEAPFVDADGNAVADVYVNTAGADALIQWLLSEEALTMAGEYGVAEYGE